MLLRLVLSVNVTRLLRSPPLAHLLSTPALMPFVYATRSASFLIQFSPYKFVWRNGSQRCTSESFE